MKAWGSRRAASHNMPAAFLDRDGTLNKNRHGVYITRPEQLKLYARVPAALKLLKKKGYRLIVVTNQSGIARGYLSAAASRAINLKFVQILRSLGVTLDAIYFCPHAPAEHCACRKPAPGLIKEAASALAIDMRRSFTVGDKPCDLHLARRAGLKGYLVLTGNGRTSAAATGRRGFGDLLTLARTVADVTKD